MQDVNPFIAEFGPIDIYKANIFGAHFETELTEPLSVQRCGTLVEFCRVCSLPESFDRGMLGKVCRR